MTQHKKQTIKVIILIVPLIILIIYTGILSTKVDRNVHTFTHNYNNGVRAERLDMYEKVNKGDIAELTHGDNQKAMNANQQALQRGQKAPYKKSKDGNYWDWFINHKSLSHGDDNSGLLASILGTDHPHRHIYYVDNQKVLEKHNINTGANFD